MMIFMNRLCNLVSFKVSWSSKRLKVCMHEIMMGGMMDSTGMMSTVRGV